MGDRLRIYFSEKNPGIFRFATFYPWKFQRAYTPWKFYKIVRLTPLVEIPVPKTKNHGNVPFQSSRRHLVSGAKLHVCSVNLTTVGPLVWIGTCNLIPHVCLFLFTRPLVHHKSKSTKKLGCEKMFHMKLYGQTLTAKYKGLTVKVKTKYVLTDWFSDHHFWFNW